MFSRRSQTNNRNSGADASIPTTTTKSWDAIPKATTPVSSLEKGGSGEPNPLRVNQTPPGSGSDEDLLRPATSVRTAGGHRSASATKTATNLDFARTVDGKTLTTGPRKSDGLSSKRRSDLRPRISRLEAALRLTPSTSSAGSSATRGIATSSFDSQVGSGAFDPRPNPHIGLSTHGSSEDFFRTGSKTGSPDESPSVSPRGSVTSFATGPTSSITTTGDRSSLVGRGSAFLGKLLSSKSLRRLLTGDEEEKEDAPTISIANKAKRMSEKSKKKNRKSKKCDATRFETKEFEGSGGEEEGENDFFEFGNSAEGVEELAVFRTSNLSAAAGTLALPSPHLPERELQGVQGGYNVNQAFVRKESSKLKAYVPKIMQEISS